jgi:tripartite-type tricarboxylate transporter receptor subunit TctC
MEINRILDEGDIKQKLLEAGADVAPISVDQFAAFVKGEIAKFQEIIRETDLTPQ